MSDMVKDYLRWILGVEGAQEVELSQIGLQTSIDAGVSAFSLALEKIYSSDPSPEQVRELVARIRQRWIKPERLNPVLAEHVILNLYGDDEYVNDVPLAEVARVENLITYGIVHEAGLDRDAIEIFLDEVVDLMSETD